MYDPHYGCDCDYDWESHLAQTLEKITPFFRKAAIVVTSGYALLIAAQKFGYL